MRQIVFLFLATLMAVAATAQPKQSIMPDSEFRFSVRNFGFLTVEGGFKKFSTEISKTKESYKVILKIDTKSLDTENHERDEHLKSKDFFDVDKYPEIVFSSETLSFKDKELEVKGSLQIKEHAKEIQIKLSRSEQGIWLGKLELDRREWGLAHGGTIGDMVKLSFKIKLSELE